MIQVYLLAVGELRCQMEKMIYIKEDPNGSSSAAVLPGWDKLADWQQDKVLRCANPGTRALCMGAQLLLQYGAYEWSARNPLLQSELVSWRIMDFSRLPESIPAPQSLAIAYGSKGKPYILHVPWHYNLSHSGDYVALAMSDTPVGIDIQQMRSYRDSMVKRFFSAEETAAYENLSSQSTREQKLLFYTLWCRKEAYGKLLGSGLTEGVLKSNMLGNVSAHLYEYGELPGYCVCVCSGEG